MSKVIDNIKNRLNELDMTQTDLAFASGLAFATVNRILNGKQVLSEKNLSKISSSLCTTPQELSNEESACLNVNGYLQIGNEITHITSFQSLKKWIKEHEDIINELPKKAKSIKSLENKNKKSIKAAPITLSNIDFYSNKEIDASQYETWSFRKSEDVREGIQTTLGNMSIGFNFEVMGHLFTNSEALYICGLFSNNTQKCRFIQKKLIDAKSGYDAKKVVRRQYEEEYGRKDWNSFNVDYMKWVVWQKIKENQQFKKLLLSIPKDAYIIENSTLQKGETSTFWGMKNKELEDARTIIEKYVAFDNATEKKGKVKELQMIERNKINNMGIWTGINMMGTILKYLQLCLINGIEPVIDRKLLNSKEIYLFGEKIKF